MAGQLKRILIADDHEVVRRGMRASLASRLDIEIVGEAANGRDALALARKTQPDIAIVDFSMPSINGRDLTIELKRSIPRIQVLIFTMVDRDDVIMSLLQAGARGFVFKSDPQVHILAAVDALAIRRPYFSPAISQALLAHSLDTVPEKAAPTLTLREREVVKLISEGNINRGVAEVLNISIKTVETHRASAMLKLNVKTTAELVRYAIRNGLVEA
jgi:DNA-binding NarL/FixJ family response regulator